MRDVDSAALEGVAKSLGIGAPGTATTPVEFDDDVLQQVLDVNLCRQVRGFPTVLTIVQTTLAGAIDRDTLDWDELWDQLDGRTPELLELNLGRENADLWITGIQGFSPDTTDLDECMAGIVLSDGNNALTARSAVLFRAVASITGSPLLAAGGREVLDQTINAQDRYPFPIKLGGREAQRLIAWMVDAGAGGAVEVNFQFHCWIGQKGLPLFHAI